ncbi:MAG: PIN domain-containing protein [Bacillota bacterium]|nr:PIN domain-containing protein [Bacillota bacterium]
MKELKLIDANIILRFLTNDEPNQAAACAKLLKRVEQNLEEVYIADLVMADIVWTLEKYYKVEKQKIREIVSRILALAGLKCSSKNTFLEALDIYADHNIDWTDAFVIAQMFAAGRQEIYSYDRDFDKVDGVFRFLPDDGHLEYP